MRRIIIVRSIYFCPAFRQRSWRSIAGGGLSAVITSVQPEPACPGEIAIPRYLVQSFLVDRRMAVVLRRNSRQMSPNATI